MKVRDLQEQLSKLDPEAFVICYTEDEQVVAPGNGFRVFEVLRADATKADLTRLEDGTPYLDFSPVGDPRPLVTIEITSDM